MSACWYCAGEPTPTAEDWAAERELQKLRKRVAELEALDEVAARANEALEQIGEQAAALLREALELYAQAECVGPTRQERARVDEMRKAIRLCALDDFRGLSAGVSNCACGHPRIGHDMWGSGQCLETETCPCEAFRTPPDHGNSAGNSTGSPPDDTDDTS